MNPGTSDFLGLHATTELIPLFAGSLSPLDPYVVPMFYWFLDLEFFLESIDHDYQTKCHQPP